MMLSTENQLTAHPSSGWSILQEKLTEWVSEYSRLLPDPSDTVRTLLGGLQTRLSHPTACLCVRTAILGQTTQLSVTCSIGCCTATTFEKHSTTTPPLLICGQNLTYHVWLYRDGSLMDKSLPLQYGREDPPQGDEAWLWYLPHDSSPYQGPFPSDEGHWRRYLCTKCSVSWYTWTVKKGRTVVKCWCCGKFQSKGAIW